MPNPWSSPSAWHFLACTSTFASFRNLASGPQPSTLLSCVTLINLMIHFDIWLILVIPKGCMTTCLIITLIIIAPFSAFQPSTLLPPDPDSFLGDDSLMRMLPWHWPPAWFIHEAQASFHHLRLCFLFFIENSESLSGSFKLLGNNRICHCFLCCLY